MLHLGREFSRHVWYQADNFEGVCVVRSEAYVFQLWHRFPRMLAEQHVVRRGTRAFEQCVHSWRTYVGKYVQRLESGLGVSGQPPSYGESAFAARYPATWEYLTLEQDGDRKRETSTILISAERGRLLACVRDRDRGLMLWVSSDTMEGLADAVEARLDGSKEADWRPDKFAARPRGGKRG